MGTSVQELIPWVGAIISDLILCNIIERCLMVQGKVTITDCLESNAPKTRSILVRIHNKLGWDNFVEGRIFKFFLDVVAPLFFRMSQMTPKR